MTRFLRACPLISACAMAAALWLLAPSPSRQALGEQELIAPKRGLLATLTVPPGFTVELVAGPPLVERPMMASFDERGRLFVCDSSGFNLMQGSSDILVKNPTNVIRLLEDKDGDGRFDSSTVFADKMTFPMGALWHQGALFTASAPSVWRLEDTRGTGTAERRTEFVSKFDFGGNACDIHGPFLAPDGRIYWANCIRGFSIPRPDGTILKGKASGVFRIRPDGKDVEMLCAGGMDNPVEVSFTDEGEAFATVDLFIGSPRPRVDAIIHCIDGGVFPYRELDRSYPKTGDVLPAMIDLGWVAPAGLTRYRGAAFGAEYRNNLFSAQFNTRRVVRHVIERDGATFRGKTEDFLVSSDPDFHPTDVFEDADGSLLVVDTGGWFLRGCPTSQIAKPEIKGAIYRVKRRADVPVLADARHFRGLDLKWSRFGPGELTRLLDDPRWVVRDRAIEQLATLGEQAVGRLDEVVVKGKTPESRRNAVWALTRIETPAARAAVRMALADADDSVRLTAANSVGVWRDALALDRLLPMATADAMPAARREAATALGRIGRAEAVPVLLEALRAGGDRFLEHAQIYALIRNADRTATRKGLADQSPRVQRAALIALDQMENGDLSREQVVPLLESTDAALQRAALSVATRRPEWSDDVAGLLRQWLNAKAISENNRALLQTALQSLAQKPAIQSVMVDSLRANVPLDSRLLLLESMARASIDKIPPAWRDALRQCLHDKEGRIVREAIAVIRARALAGLDDELLGLAKDQRQPSDVRLAALAAVAARVERTEPALFSYLREQLDANQPALTRLAAATVLGQISLDDQQLALLADDVARAGALETPHLVAGFERSRSPVVGRKLVASLKKSPGLQSLAVDAFQRLLKNYPDEVREAAKPLLARLQPDAAKQETRLTELASVLTGGNPAQGRTIFFGAKAACAGCHSVAKVGGTIGPDLTKIGTIRTPRDLLESIVFPSSSIVRGYETVNVNTKAGRAHSGILGRETAAAVTLIATDRAEVRIGRGDIDEIAPSRVSIMPQGLDTQLSRRELGDLIAFLAGLK
jgi:putative membrane-bound dehydrogenase-like protein